MDDMKRAWDEVGDGFAKLGKMISERYRGHGAPDAAPSGAATDNAVSDAIRRATDELDRAFTSLGDTLRDNAAQDQMRETGKKLTEALKTTFTEVSDEIRRTVGGNRPGDSGGRPPGPDEPSAPDTQA